MTEVKVIQRHFGCIATSVDDGSPLPFCSKYAAIYSWKPAASKVRVFGTPVPPSYGISTIKSITQKPTLKAMLDDFYLSVRSKAPLILTAPNVSISPICAELNEFAQSKNMGISWAFFAYNNPADQFPSILGLTPPVVKIISEEIPHDIYFEDGKWQEWLFKWIKKYMQAHRYFDATRFGLAEKWPETNPPEPKYFSEEPINVYEKMGETIPEPVEVAREDPVKVVKKRGRPKKK